MSNDTAGRDDPDMTSVNLRLTEAMLEDIDAVWREEGFTSRSEFMRAVLRDATAHPGLSRRMWKQIAASEYKRAEGEQETVSREEVLARMNADE